MRGKDVRKMRRALGWTQIQLAEALSVTGNTVARWERDEVAITEPMARLIRMTFAAQKGSKEK